MQEHILVSLNRRDTTHQLIPYLDKIAKPGMRVVFLIRGSASNWPRMAAHLAAMQGGNLVALENCEILERAMLESKERLADSGLAKLRGALRRRGVEVEVRMYVGSFKKVVEDIAQKRDVRFVVMPAGGFPWFRILRPLAGPFKMIKRSPLSPVLLFRPSPMEPGRD
jgi:hypothetical protein